jgi:hypothetical protein
MSQVTIGSLLKPAKGALLDLKTQLPDAGNVTSTSGGLLLPRVELNKTSDFSLIPNITSAQKKDYTGLLVYNLKIDEKLSLEKGVYQWSGEEWKMLSKITKTEGVTIKKEIYQGSAPDPNKIVSLGKFEFRIIKRSNNNIYSQFQLSSGFAKQPVYWHVNEYWDKDPNKEASQWGESGYSFKLDKETISPSIWYDCSNNMLDSERNEIWLADLKNNNMYQIQFITFGNGTVRTYLIIAKRY